MAVFSSRAAPSGSTNPFTRLEAASSPVCHSSRALRVLQSRSRATMRRKRGGRAVWKVRTTSAAKTAEVMVLLNLSEKQ